MATRRTRHISIGIERSFAEVYGFLVDPANFPQWADGLGHAFVQVGDHDWRVETPTGEMTIRFTGENPFGIVDHIATPDGGAAITNPMRVIENGDGSEVVFTLFQRDGMSDEAFEGDADWVAKDLAVLKALLEG